MNWRSCTKWARRSRVASCHRPASSKRTEFKHAVESLEPRNLMTVTWHGGAVLPHVEVQPVFYGRDWYTNGALTNQTSALNGYLDNIVHSSYMDMLTNAGYGVGRGTEDLGKILLTNVDKRYYLQDSQIRSDLQATISNGSLATPDANRLFIVYVEPGVAIMNGHDHNSTSQKDFLGYHGAFAGHDRFGRAADIHYAVIAYPGGLNFSANSQGFRSNFDQLTGVTSHELAESVTDPNVNYKALGWYDNARGEIGDIVNGQEVLLNGYVVQRESNKSDGAMSPAGWHAYTRTSSSFSTPSNAFDAASRAPIVNATITVAATGGTAHDGYSQHSTLTVAETSTDRRALHSSPSSDATDQVFAELGDESLVPSTRSLLGHGTGRGNG